MTEPLDTLILDSTNVPAVPVVVNPLGRLDTATLFNAIRLPSGATDKANAL